MKVTCISTSRIPSDTANSIQVMKACQGLARVGHEVHLLVPDFMESGSTPAGSEPVRSWDGLAERYGLSTPFQISWLRTRPVWKRNDFAWQCVRQAAAARADVLYTWTGQSAVFGLLCGLPVVYEVHDLPTGRLGPWWFRAFMRLKGRKRLLVITRALQNSLEMRFGRLPEDEIVIAPNGVDLEQYADLPEAPEARRMAGLPERITVLCAGHLYAGRGLELFLGLAGRFPQTSFVWVGGRPEDVITARLAVQKLGLENVTFTGFISNRRLPYYQAAADILLMPYGRMIAGSSGGNSADICSPMKMFDYLAAGRAILSSDLPVIHEVLKDTNAVFASPDDLASWAEALANLLDAPDLRSRLGFQARRDAASYSWQARAESGMRGVLA